MKFLNKLWKTISSRHFTSADPSYPLNTLVDILLKRLFRQYPEVSNVSVTLVLPGGQHLSLGQIPFGRLLLLRHCPRVFGLLRLHPFEVASQLLDLISPIVTLLLDTC